MAACSKIFIGSIPLKCFDLNKAISVLISNFQRVMLDTESQTKNLPNKKKLTSLEDLEQQ